MGADDFEITRRSLIAGSAKLSLIALVPQLSAETKA